MVAWGSDTVAPMESVVIVAAALIGICLICAIPGVLLTLGFIRLHDRLWKRVELRWPWLSAEMADTERRFRNPDQP